MKSRSLEVFLLSWMMAWSGMGAALEPEDVSIEEQMLVGLVLDRTVTPPGHAFYDYFADAWLHHPDVQKYNLTIEERPSARRGSLIKVLNRDKLLYQVITTPARSRLKSTAEQAATTVAKKLRQQELSNIMFDDPDLLEQGF